jgi:glutamate N-acetyltransferase/amino-acid N-acetyltransferase
VADTFNCITVDGATSTNDTVLLLASGQAGPVDALVLEAAVTRACAGLAEQMVADAEGATKLVRIHVDGAHSDEEARTAARAVAKSQLTKSSRYGKDPYWGRIASDLGAAGVAFDPVLLSIAYGDTIVCRHGIEVDHDTAAVKEHMDQRDISITAHLGLGGGKATVLTCDLTHAYVDENMGTS